MTGRNDRARKEARSFRRRCKIGRWATDEAARNWIDNLAVERPLRALGMQPYECEVCGFYHVGRAQSR